MTETRPVDGLTAQFKAAVPKKQIADAEQFLNLLQGTQPSANDVQTGKKVLADLDAQKELYEFQAAVLAGQEAKSDSDLDRRVNTIAQTIRPAEVASDKLRDALKAYV